MTTRGGCSERVGDLKASIARAAVSRPARDRALESAAQDSAAADRRAERREEGGLLGNGGVELPNHHAVEEAGIGRGGHGGAGGVGVELGE
mmetsp:Transcript_64849/g.146284  ORF Transcript_64849/g.146284 Transcript_64849/m.146284 type:complete len:91 (+) Transcript_64849:162-434(+)